MAPRALPRFGAAIVASLFIAQAAMADEAIDARLDRLEQTVKTQSAEIDQLKANGASAAPAPADTTFGGYGEATLNVYHTDRARNQADLRRFVLFVGHRFDDRWSFNGEVEWEHAVASAGDAGETEIEQAYLTYRVAPAAAVNAGLLLMPFGFLNPSHEPPAFYGVERNEVETRIIPSTWREGGVSFAGTTPFGLETNVGVTTGFDTAKFDDASAPLASVHQEMQLAKAHDPSFYGALNYRGLPGFNVGGAAFTGRSDQGNADFNEAPSQPDLSGLKTRVTLWETHARWQRAGLDVEALYAEGRISGAGGVDRALDAFNVANGDDRALLPSRFNGWLTQAAYTVWRRGDLTVAPFVRYERFDTQAAMPDGFGADPANRDDVTTAGLSLKPRPDIVFKADYQSYRRHPGNDRTNVGVGYMF